MNNNSDSEKAVDEQFEQRTASPDVGKRQKVKAHSKKWWWIYLILFCAGFLIITLPIIYVGFPNIAQHGVNKARLEVTGLEFYNPTPDHIEVTERIITHNPSMYTPTLDPWSGGTFVVTNGTYSEKAILYLPVPKTHTKHPVSNAAIVNATVPIYDQDQIALYATQLLTLKQVTTALVGKPLLHIGKLPAIHVKYNASTTYNGLNGLQGFNVTNIRIDPGNTLLILPNMNGTAFIPNPSNITVDMGNVTFSLKDPKGVEVGKTLIENMVLRPGDNHIPLIGMLNQTLILPSLENGFANLTITGTDVVYNGKHITYYEKALAANILHLRLNVFQILKDSLGV
ncbi:hypothetical protein LHYA1_G008744 [Lachnellula hyalina]|uniref:Uncharacterized protein n=1 Tax=Lachnellula hyalina TaxID=1316788 RepID=A0A8H8TVN9_9HELO|nr:uncharacterized protein LHYA1_G008744 [Lachnellula hyalina]TVY22435.1 hypothetical protein LHYA1_G008744 [Lachnellula hyalina]